MILRVVLAVFVLVAGSGEARAEGVYTIQSIDVEEQGDDLVAAREQAVRRAKNEAFQRVLQRMVLNPGMLPGLRNSEIDHMVDQLSFNRESFGGDTYFANLSISFEPRLVQRYLLRNNTRYSEQRPEPVNVMPLIRVGGAYLHPDLVPFNDWPYLFDTRDAGDDRWLVPKRVVEPNFGSIDRIAAMIDQGRPIGSRGSGDDSTWILLVDLPALPSELASQASARLELLPWTEDIPVASPREAEVMLPLRGGEINWQNVQKWFDDQINSIWLEGVLTEQGSLNQVNQIRVAWVGTSLQQKIRIRESLEAVHLVSALRVLRQSPVMMVLEFSYRGNTDNLIRTLERQGLQLSGDQLPLHQSVPTGTHLLSKT